MICPSCGTAFDAPPNDGWTKNTANPPVLRYVKFRPAPKPEPKRKPVRRGIK